MELSDDENTQPTNMEQDVSAELSSLRVFGDGMQKEMAKQANAVSSYRSRVVQHGRPMVSEQLDQDIVDEEQAARDELKTIGAARAVETAAQQPMVVVHHCNARELSRFFAMFGETAVDPSTSALPAAFATRTLGSVMHTPGVAQEHGPTADTPAAEQERLRSVAQLIASARHVSQTQLESRVACIDSVTQAGVWRVTDPETLRVGHLTSQMVIPLPNATVCQNGARCMALTELPPHPKIGRRMPLKAMQRNAAWQTFLRTGTWICEGEVGKSLDLCVPCTIAQYCIAARARQGVGKACGDIRFPFSVTTSCAGGFAPTHILSDSTMTVAWPAVEAHDYVPVERQVEYAFVNQATRKTEIRRETLYGYDFRAEIQFDESRFSCGSDDYTMLPPRAGPTVITKDVVAVELPEALSSDVRTRLAADLPHMSNIEEALRLMAVEFEATVRTCMSATDEATETHRRVRFSPYWQAAMMRVPQNVLSALGDINSWRLSTHSITTSVMWRTGLCYTLQSTELSGNSNLSDFLDAHTAVQLWVLEQWATLKHPPSDAELVGDSVALLTVESVCAVLRLRGLYPVYTVPHLSPKQHQEVRVHYTHRRRTPAMELVRAKSLPEELVKDTAVVSSRQQCRLALQWLGEREPSVSSGDGESALCAQSPLPSPDSLVSLLHSCAHDFRQWVARAVSLVALQTDFDDSVWLLDAIVARWPWFERAAAAYTRSAQLPLSADPAAAAALNAGRWTPHGRRFDSERDMTEPARPAAVPVDAPAWVNSIVGFRRFTAEYQHADSGETVSLGQHLFPDALLNRHGQGVHRERYIVLAAMRCRVFELQRLCSIKDHDLVAAFDRRLEKMRPRAVEAHNLRPHPDRHVVTLIRDTLGQELVDDDNDNNDDDDDDDDNSTGSVPVNEKIQLKANASSVDAAKKLTAQWSASLDKAVDDSLDAATQMTESVGVELIRPLFGGEVDPPSLYADDETGPPVMGPKVDTSQAYARRCALFETLEMAYHANKTSDASDEWWHAIPDGSPLSRLHQHKPLANGAPCEDSLPDLSQYIGLNSLREASAPSFLSDACTRHSWVTQVATVTYKACFMRDWPESHSKNCAHSEYLAWAAQSMLVTALGTYRHACRTLPFARAVEMYRDLRIQNAETIDGRRQLAKYLNTNKYMVLLAGQEFQMMTVTGSRAESRVMRTAWPSFSYVQECWVPQRAERLRAVLSRGDRSLDAKEVYAANLVRGPNTAGATSTPAIVQVPPSSSSLDPRVFRHMPNTWPLQMLELFSSVEISRQTDAVVNSGRETISLLPRFVNTVPPETKHLMSAFFSRTDPQEPIRLDWFAKCGVSAAGLARLVLANAVYTVQGDNKVMNYLVESMTHADFFFAWTAMHIMVLHRDTMIMPLPWQLTRRQFEAVKYRVANMQDPASHASTHMTLCHLLGCPGPQSYTVPFADAEHYGADETALAIDLGQQTCKRSCTEEMFDRLVRRNKESPVQAGLDQMKTLRATLQASDSPADRLALQNDINRLHEKLITQQAKNVRATAAVAFNRPCNEARSRKLQIVGAMVVQRNSVHARSMARVYTACPMCGVPTIYSMDRYGANGFTCGKCNIEERWALHGNWCVSCGMVEQGSKLPELAGEAQAAARAARTQHHICGSTAQPRSLRSGASRRRHGELLRRQILADKAVSESKAGKMKDIDGKAIDTSDTLATPVASTVTKAVADRLAGKKSARRVKPRRENIAATYGLGRNRTEVHPCAVRMRMDPFTAMPLIDDRVGGLNTTAVFSVCGPCLTRVRFATVSLANLLLQSRADPTEIWVNGRRIAVGTNNIYHGPRFRRSFKRRASDGQPEPKRRGKQPGDGLKILPANELPPIPREAK